MDGSLKKLSIAFYWHMHQPVYQLDSVYLMPWARLHAVKDYLDMLKKIDNHNNLKLNFNFSPVLLSSLQRYAKGAKDVHLKLLLKNEKELTPEDKIFILNNYFDLNYSNYWSLNARFPSNPESYVIPLSVILVADEIHNFE